MEINLSFGLKYDLEALEKNIVIPIVRLLGLIDFKGKDKWSDPYDIIIDTGSPISVFPSYIQKEADVTVLYKTKISGLVPDEKATLSVNLVDITFRLGDRQKVTDPLKNKVYIADTDRIPLILGFSDMLNYELKINYPKKKASLLI